MRLHMNFRGVRRLFCPTMTRARMHGPQLIGHPASFEGQPGADLCTRTTVSGLNLKPTDITKNLATRHTVEYISEKNET